MTRLDVNVARCEALFASGLQRSDAPSAAVVAADFTGVESTNTPGTHRVTAVAPRYSRRRRAACSMTSSVSRYSDRICWCRSETGLLLEHSDVPWQWCRIRCLVGSVASRAKGWKVWVCCSSAGAQREALSGLLAGAADGYSGALVLRGEAGMGKAALLEETLAAAAAAGLRTTRLTGVEAETQLGYAGLHRFLLPFAGHLERLPVPQRDALRSTFGLAAGPPGRRRPGSWWRWRC